MCCTVLVFEDFNIHPGCGRTVFLVLSFGAMLMYEMYWCRYFKSKKSMADFYSSFMGIPVAGASLPVTAFVLLGIYGKNPLLILSAVVLGIGHIGIHLKHKMETEQKL